ncbi:7-carboxy-7-deazaguanine synthase QueE [Francisella sp. Scap27]|uniref:7-carboxy-7-deazaguanine synthase QueE n=1 Tax=Francisella sp. Scap27 TaxID=2589986 RepID=UPI0015BFCFEA|nr:7-carboxy-7-deazaguanine synthase QueE [Francisella sp. Scap27]
MKDITYSEIFYSPQGEGHYTGVASAWIRFFSCNLQCDGFGQKDPTNPNTYDLPYKTCDASDIKRMKDLPVFETGCDSSYSWSKKFKHLAKTQSVIEAVNELENILPTKKFLHKNSKQEAHLCITGGEPLINQDQIVGLLQEFERRGNLPKFVTIETNGTQRLNDCFKRFIEKYISEGNELFLSVSPKLFSITGEKREKAFKPEIIKEYYDLSFKGQLKFVIDNNLTSQNEMEELISILREYEVYYNIWCMPLGALKEQQYKIAREVAEYASSKGYYTCARVHTYLFGNEIGT